MNLTVFGFDENERIELQLVIELAGGYTCNQKRDKMNREVV